MSKNDKKTQMDRRKFMQMSALASGYTFSSPFQLYLATMFSNFVGQAYAQATNEFSDFKFVNFCMMGGAPRWMFDLPLNPQTTDTMSANSQVITRLNSSLVGSYATTTVGGIRMPYMWSGLLARPSGSIAMSGLANNLLITRGIDLQIDSHTICPQLMIRPVPSSSLTGMAADSSTTPIPAVSFDGSLAFVSHKGLACYDINPFAGNPLSIALSPFTNAGGITELSNAQIEAGIDNVLNLMKTQSGDSHQYLPTTYEARVGAKALMKRNFGDLTAQFNTLRDKYQSLIQRSFTDASLFLTDVEDLVVPGSTTSMSMNLNGDADGGQPGRYTGTDFNDVFTANMRIRNLAEGMAFTEFMLVNGLTSSINIITMGMEGLIFDSYRRLTSGTQNVSSTAFTNLASGMGLDMHDVGSHTTLILMTKFFRAWGSCFYELINALKNKAIPGGNLFQKTIIAHTSDFNRIARTNGSGSDHGWEGSNFSIYSGMIPNLEVLGNVSSDSSGGYAGTWGKAGNIAELGNRRMLIGNVASTVATMMNLPSPTPNDNSLVQKNSSGMCTFTLPRGRNV